MADSHGEAKSQSQNASRGDFVQWQLPLPLEVGWGEVKWLWFGWVVGYTAALL